MSSWLIVHGAAESPLGRELTLPTPLVIATGPISLIQRSSECVSLVDIVGGPLTGALPSHRMLMQLPPPPENASWVRFLPDFPLFYLLD